MASEMVERELVKRLAKEWWSYAPERYLGIRRIDWGIDEICGHEAWWWLNAIADDPETPPEIVTWLRTQAGDSGDD